MTHWMDRERVLAARAASCRLTGRPAGPILANARESHEEILARSPFRYVHRLVYEFTRVWTIEQTIGYLYSTSLPLRQMLGDRRPAFEEEVTDALLAIDPSGRFTEPVALEVLMATKTWS